MAREFGGKYSPGARATSGSPTEQAQKEARAEERSVDAAGAKANLLFVPGILGAFLSINDGAYALALGLGGGALMVLAAWLMREGLRAEAAYNARAMASRPALPRKILAALFIGFGAAAFAVSSDPASGASSAAVALIFGLAAGLLTLGAFGIDPLKNKRMEGIDSYQQDRVARMVREAEGYMSAMKGQIETLNEKDLTRRVDAFLASARRMIRTVEEDPRDLTAARKFLSVYLMGARDATVKFVDVFKRNRLDVPARLEYEKLLSDLEQQFSASTARMLEDDRSDMDIEIKVLRDRLQREGVRTE